ncbi:GspE/PulE family protein [Aureibaculum luteum]|uniref:GspE/PulE family protein n=1 Tax=Aureibaculum luteum TaxID=1548456 RepID=UPI000E4F4FB0|nr:GspE/PulE family protein [Aureibaculum luteum]
MSDNFNIATQLQQLISAEQAYHYRIIPHSKQNGSIIFKSDKENQENLKNELQIILGKKIELLLETTENIQQYLSQNYRKTNTAINTQLTDSKDLLINIIHEAKSLGSSDIHFEAFEHTRRVRFRIDGKLLERYVIPTEEYPKIINQLKVKSGLDIAEKRLPQDGRININTPVESYDIRVSSLPTLHGEKLVLRLLSKEATNIQLDKLGFTDEDLRRYKNSVKNQNGIVLISGPTGSGKTTTLYATLKLLNTNARNILTIEDPIEYTLEGINQVQLKENIGLDFAKSLRTFLRQDPDIIMVGEIRDVDTANMAVRASLTGHLVLSTIHTNSAWATISRLIDMGVPSFLIASTLKVSVAQRLVRKLCNHCKSKATVSKELFPDGFEIPKSLTQHYKAVGCSDCFHTGYSGRKAIYEIIPITRELTEQIKKNSLEIDAYIKTKKIATLKDNALQLVVTGETSIEEVYPLLTDF